MSDRTPTPIECFWDGDAFRPINDWWKSRARRQFTEGEVYHLADQPERSSRSHNHYFASVAEAWKNLPDALAERFPTADHLRRYALIKAGYCDSTTMVCSSKAEAQRVASFIRPTDEFGIVIVTEATVTRYAAKSQSMRAMGKDEFQKSKDAVLGIISEMIGVERKALEGAA